MGGGGSAQLTQSGFKVEYDRSGRARRKQCKVKISRLDLRMGKLVYSFLINLRGRPTTSSIQGACF